MTTRVLDSRMRRIIAIAREHGFNGSTTESLIDYIEQQMRDLATLRAMLAAPKQTDWRDQPPTMKQLQYLLHLGHNGGLPTSKGDAHDLIQRLVEGDEHPHPLTVRAMRLRP